MIRQDKHLSLEGLNQLFNNEIMALCIENFQHYENLPNILEKIKNEQSSSYQYQNNLVSHIGNSSYQIDDDETRYQHYYNNVEKNYSIMKALFSPAETPIEILEKKLTQIWQPGFFVETFHQHQMFAGILRLIHNESAIHAHQDHVKWSNPRAIGVDDMVGQFGINFFLKTPTSGGALLMWDKELSEAEFLQQSNNDFCIPVNKLSPPHFHIVPQVGMLIILNARKLHAIECCIGSERIAMSCFLGYRGPHKPISIWS